MNVRKARLDDLSTLVRFTAAEAQEAEGATKDLTQLEIGIKTAQENGAQKVDLSHGGLISLLVIH